MSPEGKLACLSRWFAGMGHGILLAGLTAFPGRAWELVQEAAGRQCGCRCPGLDGKTVCWHTPATSGRNPPF